MIVKDIMSYNPAVCLTSTSLSEVARLMVRHECGEIPVVKSHASKEVIGVITDRDICCRAIAADKNPQTTHAGEFMSSPVFTISADTDLSKALKVFEEKEVRRLPVVDKSNNCVGVLSLADIAEKAPELYAREILRGTSRPGVGDIGLSV
jgi:CBS domain-containing protein